MVLCETCAYLLAPKQKIEKWNKLLKTDIEEKISSK